MTGDVKPLKLFISYSHADEEFMKELLKELKPLEREKLIEVWHDRMLEPGEEWKKSIDQNLNDSDVVLLLVSRDFINSYYCYEKEMARAMERRQAGEATVISILLRPCNWQDTPLGGFQAIPRDDKPIDSTHWHSQDEAYQNVGKELRGVIKRLRPQMARSH